MKRTTKFLATVVSSIIAATGASAADFTFKYGNEQPEASIRSQSMVFFEKELEDRSGGRIEVETFFGGALGNEREMMDQVTSGLLQGTRGGFFADASGAFNLYQLPFLVASWDEMQCLVGSDFTKEIGARAAANGYHVPATGISQGFRAYTNNVKPITKVEDLAGLKIREPQSDLMIATGTALGSVPVAMPFSETYQAFQQGVIDGQHNPPQNIWDFKVHEVQKYLSLTNHMTGPDPLIVNKAWYDALPADLQAIFDEVSVEALAMSDNLYRDAETNVIEDMKEFVEINTLEPAALTGFQTAVEPVYAQMIDAGHFSQDDIDAARAAAQSCN
ncbi:TRAP transporter substrate-binding protein [Rhodobacteraceae bacterium B1Z28]|uniref:TRAP transporter substrate-binding protein n=1 Tax=Ruegeria haliotis TaxID=2747601 RepID=A0ABX2PUS0_9RHOB|nr:TRAP transporter substrate-binding protein [Ruegeria haliotis]NVO57925.1 TRAP transporter substrate-binding protein [Ruegeria haliotis]